MRKWEYTGEGMLEIKYHVKHERVVTHGPIGAVETVAPLPHLRKSWIIIADLRMSRLHGW